MPHVLRIRILPNINRQINGYLGYKTLSFVDAYSGYNHIKMDSINESKTAFMSTMVIITITLCLLAQESWGHLSEAHARDIL